MLGPRTILFKKNLEVIISHDLDYAKNTDVVFDLQTIDGDEIATIIKSLSGKKILRLFSM